MNDSIWGVYVFYYKYVNASNNHFYFSQVPTAESYVVTGIDSTGTAKFFYSRLQTNPQTHPYQFFQDSVRRTWFVNTTGSSITSGVFPPPTPGVTANAGQWRPRPYKLLKPTTYFPYTKDTLLFFAEPNGGRKAALRKTWPGYLPTANTRYWYWDSLRIRWFNSVEREDKDNFYIVARDSSATDLIFKYRIPDSTLIWTKKFDSSIVTLKGYAVNGAFYAVSTQGNDVFVRKFNGVNGDVVWTKSIAVPVGHIFKIGDFGLSKERQKITVAGYFIDTLISSMSKLHIVTFDTLGNEINSFTKEGYTCLAKQSCYH